MIKFLTLVIRAALGHEMAEKHDTSKLPTIRAFAETAVLLRVSVGMVQTLEFGQTLFPNLEELLFCLLGLNTLDWLEQYRLQYI